jgi:cell division protein FtsL
VLSVVFGLYVQQTVAVISTHSRAQHQLAVVQRLARENRRLLREQQALSDPATIQQKARVLGMVRSGERPYVVTGLPGG